MEQPNKLSAALHQYVQNHEIAGAAALVRKEGRLVYQETIGYADMEKGAPVTMDTMFRLASMSKPVTGIAVMQLAEQGKLSLSDPVSRYMPEFARMKVCETNLLPMMYAPDANSPTGQKAIQEQVDAMTYLPAQRDITFFDLMTHSSGLAMGPVGCAMMDRLPLPAGSLQERVRQYASLPLDFQPGTASGYSPLAAFDLLGGLVELISGLPFEQYLKEKLFAPLGVRDIAFTLTPDQAERVPRLYEYTEDGKLTDVTLSNDGWGSMNPAKIGYPSGGGGLFGTVKDYEKIAHMLVNKGQLDGVRVLKEATVEAMAGAGMKEKHRPFPGSFWGLSMMVFDDCRTSKRGLTDGTFGWSGAFGTHFYIDPANQLERVLGVNRSNIGGAGSYVSLAAEQAVFEEYLQK